MHKYTSNNKHGSFCFENNENTYPKRERIYTNVQSCPSNKNNEDISFVCIPVYLCIASAVFYLADSRWWKPKYTNIANLLKSALFLISFKNYLCPLLVLLKKY